MELCSSTALRFKLSTPRFNVRFTSHHFSNPRRLNNKFTNFQKFTSYQQFLPQRSSTWRNSSQHFVSASSVALNTEEDRLPADIEVTETVEPSSTVSIDRYQSNA